MWKKIQAPQRCYYHPSYEKCSFYTESADYLGRTVYRRQRTVSQFSQFVNHVRIAKLRYTVSIMHGFFASGKYLRTYHLLILKDFRHLTSTMDQYSYISHDHFSEEQVIATKELKMKISESLILALPAPDHSFMVDTVGIEFEVRVVLLKPKYQKNVTLWAMFGYGYK